MQTMVYSLAGDDDLFQFYEQDDSKTTYMHHHPSPLFRAFMLIIS